MAEGGRIEPGTLRTRPRTDGSIPDPQSPQPARWAGECPDCRARGTSPTHSPIHPGPYYAVKLRAKREVVAARAYLAQVDAAYVPCEFPRPLAGHLRAVLAVIDKEAIG